MLFGIHERSVALGLAFMVTLQDVAREAGVSIATASWAINDNRHVRIPEATQERVRKVAQKLGYRQNALARGLARGQSDLIGFISDGVATSPFAGQVLQGAQDEAWRSNKLLLVIDTNGDDEIASKACAFMLEHQVEGIAYSSWVHHLVTPPNELSKVNTVLINCFDSAMRYPAVVPDEVQGGEAATNLLLAAGHTRVAFINDKVRTPASVGRLKGYKQALAKARIPYDPSLVILRTADQEGGYSAAGAVLASGADSVFCHNDRTAMGLYDALKSRGKRIPEDFSIVGFDNQEVIADHLHPALSTVGLPQYALGVLGIRLLLANNRLTEQSSVTDDNEESAKTNIRIASRQETLVPCPVVKRQSIKPV